MEIAEFEEQILDLLADIAPNASIIVGDGGEIVIFTNLVEDLNGDLVELEETDEDDFDEDDEDDDDDKEFDNEESEDDDEE